jgi:hypothetical protein
VITRSFDTREALERIKREGDSAADDDGQLLKDETERSEYPEVAHILPHSLMTQGIFLVCSASDCTCFGARLIIL